MTLTLIKVSLLVAISRSLLVPLTWQISRNVCFWVVHQDPEVLQYLTGYHIYQIPSIRVYPTVTGKLDVIIGAKERHALVPCCYLYTT